MSAKRNRPFRYGLSVWTGSALLNLEKPDPRDIRLEDIARNLSRLARFNGSTSRTYTVAEHSLHMARRALAEGRGFDGAALALMHDSPEYVVGDTIAPVKSLCPDFQAVEARVWAAIAARFGFATDLPEWVHHMDAAMCATEKRDLVLDPRAWPGPPPYPELLPFRAPDARRLARDFLTMAADLGLK